MDPNLFIWKVQGQCFLNRLRTWFNLLDPSLLLSSDAEILKAHVVLESGKKLNEKDEPAAILSLSSVHADSGATLPLIFRPPAFFPVLGPLAVASLLPHSGVKTALLWQFLFQSYSVGFNYMNRNSSAEQGTNLSLKQHLIITGTVLCSTIAGALPQIFINRLHLRSPMLQTFCKSILPIPLSATLAAFNVLTVRSEESETGIKVFDCEGNFVGISKAAGEKALRETAQSRAVLFGVTAAIPNLLILLIQRTRYFQRNPLLVAPCRYMSTALVLGLMLPISFSLFPQLRTIKTANVKVEVPAGVVGEDLYYHRGV